MSSHVQQLSLQLDQKISLSFFFRRSSSNSFESRHKKGFHRIKKRAAITLLPQHDNKSLLPQRNSVIFPLFPSVRIISGQFYSLELKKEVECKKGGKAVPQAVTEAALDQRKVTRSFFSLSLTHGKGAAVPIMVGHAQLSTTASKKFFSVQDSCCA